MIQNQHSRLDKSSKNRTAFILIPLLGVILYLLWSEYEVQLKALSPYLPYLFLLVCPLMHVFMHRGHGGDKQSSACKSDTHASVADREKQD
ncbi:DUF2933 domain-containing protein [Pseudomonadota bacterium]